MSHDTPEAIAITDQAALGLFVKERPIAVIEPRPIPVIGEICPVGTFAKLQKMTALVKQLRELL